MRKEFLSFHVPHIEEAEINAVVEVLRAGWLTTGKKVRQFEQEFANFIGVRNAIAVNSGTAALHLALESSGVAEGDEVIVPTMTFAATAEVALYLRANPVLVDCSADSLNLDPVAVERAVTSRTRAVIPVHHAGEACELDTIGRIAGRHGLSVIEDAAHALPAAYKGTRIGGISDFTCFSFYATKGITTGEGGMITTNNDAVVERIRCMSLHGISKDAWKRYTVEGSWSYQILYAGYKYNMTDLAAALGLVQLSKINQFMGKRRMIAHLYTEQFADLPELELPRETVGSEHSWHLYVLRLNLERLTINRDSFIEELKKQKILTSVHFIPLHLHQFYVQKLGCRPEDFPNATAAFHRIVSLPIFPGMSQSDVSDVVDAVRSTVTRFRK